MRIELSLIVLAAALASPGCATYDARGASAPPTLAAPADVQAVRGAQIVSRISFNLAYAPGDPNAASVQLRDYEGLFRTALNQCGKSDGNTFEPLVRPTGTNYGFDVQVFTDGAPQPYTRWSLSCRLSDDWAGTHLFDDRTRGYENVGDAIDELAPKVYAHFHSGWSWNK